MQAWSISTPLLVGVDSVNKFRSGNDMMGRVEPDMTKPTISTESKNTGGDHQRGKEVNDSAWPGQNPEKSNVQLLWKKREPVQMIEFQ